MSHFCGHSPQGECGLKLINICTQCIQFRSLPARGVWIETISPYNFRRKSESLPARGVWIETPTSPLSLRIKSSLPARGVWIETGGLLDVDGNKEGHSPQGECGLKHANLHQRVRRFASLPARGVWIETHGRGWWRCACRSLPARGVWIETSTIRLKPSGTSVTPRKGSVD